MLFSEHQQSDFHHFNLKILFLLLFYLLLPFFLFLFAPFHFNIWLIFLQSLYKSPICFIIWIISKMLIQFLLNSLIILPFKASIRSIFFFFKNKIHWCNYYSLSTENSNFFFSAGIKFTKLNPFILCLSQSWKIQITFN